jgi:DNA-binding helix-hairpin-helix protein with protein kinase domain
MDRKVASLDDLREMLSRREAGEPVELVWPSETSPEETEAIAHLREMVEKQNGYHGLVMPEHEINYAECPKCDWHWLPKKGDHIFINDVECHEVTEVHGDEHSLNPWLTIRQVET